MGEAADFRRANLQESESNPTTIVIPASLTVLTPAFFANTESVKIVKFESGSQIGRLESGTFGLCRSLKSICIAASVVFIDENCFIGDSPRPFEFWDSRLQAVTFEAGSQLREIAPRAFARCFSLKRICIPSSVEKMTGDSFHYFSFSRIEFEPGNPYLARQGDFVVGLKDHRLVVYAGTSSTMAISDEIEVIGRSCFASCLSICSVTFGPSPKLSSIETRAFASCGNLGTITIPSSVAFLGENCFSECSALRTVSCSRDSRLNRIPVLAFAGCEWLESVVTAICRNSGSRVFQWLHQPCQMAIASRF
jgi:hypothetical protein